MVESDRVPSIRYCFSCLTVEFAWASAVSVKSPISLLLGVIQIVEVILNGMVLMCIVASYFVLAGFSASFASGGGFGNNYYSPFEGTELEQVRQLDQQYTILRAPLIYGGVAVSLGLGVLTMGVLLR